MNNYISRIRLYILSFLVSLTVFGCHPEEPGSDSTPIFKGDFVDGIAINQYFDSTSFVFLEGSDEALFAHADDIKFFNNRWYILDKILKSLLCFENDGAFVFSVHRVGKGPGEFILPESFLIHKDRREVWLQCRMRQQVLRYDLDGHFIDEFKLGRAGFDMAYLNKEQIVLYDQDYHYFGELDSTYPGLFILDEQFDRKEQLYRITGNRIIENFSNMSKNLSVYDDTCYFIYSSDSLYSITPDQNCSVTAVFNFGKYHLPKDLYDTPNRNSLSDRIINSGKVISKDYLVADQNYFFLSLGLNNSIWYGIVDRKTREFRISQRFTNLLNHQAFAFPQARKDEDELVGFISADYCVAINESLQSLSPDQHNVYTRSLAKFTEKAMHASGNVLVILKLKDQ